MFHQQLRSLINKISKVSLPFGYNMLESTAHFVEESASSSLITGCFFIPKTLLKAFLLHAGGK